MLVLVEVLVEVLVLVKAPVVDHWLPVQRLQDLSTVLKYSSPIVGLEGFDASSRTLPLKPVKCVSAICFYYTVVVVLVLVVVVELLVLVVVVDVDVVVVEVEVVVDEVVVVLVLVVVVEVEVLVPVKAIPLQVPAPS